MTTVQGDVHTVHLLEPLNSPVFTGLRPHRPYRPPSTYSVYTKGYTYSAKGMDVPGRLDGRPGLRACPAFQKVDVTLDGMDGRHPAGLEPTHPILPSLVYGVYV